MSEKLKKILVEIKKVVLRKNPVEGLLFVVKNLPYWVRGQMIFASPGAIIKHAQNIRVDGALYIDLANTGFLHDGDRSFLNVNGRMVIHGKVTIGRGSRFDIGPAAVCTLTNCKISGMSNFIIQYALVIEESSRIAWGCELMDNDQHVLLRDAGHSMEHSGITVQKNVWVGSRVLILKNVTIGEGSVIGAGAVVTKTIPPHVLAAGNPARVIRENVNWQN